MTKIKLGSVFAISLLLGACVSNSTRVSPVETSTPVELSPKQQTVRSASELITTISEIDSLSFSKGEYEKESKFMDRMKGLYDKYDGHRFIVPIKCDLPIGEGKKLVTYNAELERAILQFPDMDIEGVILKQGNKITFPDYKYSFIPVAEPSSRTSTYTASNAFGKEVEVTKVERNRTGLAVLTAGTRLFKGPTEFWSTDAWMKSLPKPLKITFPLSRDIARQNLEGCIVNLDVQVQYSGIWPIYKQQSQFYKQQSKEYGLIMLFVNKVELDPTISRPVELKTEDKGIPVDLLGISIVSPSGSQLLSKKFY